MAIIRMAGVANHITGGNSHNLLKVCRIDLHGERIERTSIDCPVVKLGIRFRTTANCTNMRQVVSKGISCNILVETAFTVIADHKRRGSISAIHDAIVVRVAIEKSVQEIGIAHQAITYASQIIQIPARSEAFRSINQLTGKVQTSRRCVKRCIGSR